MQLTVQVEKTGVARLLSALGDKADKLPRHLAAAVNATAKTVRVQAAKELGQVLNIKGHGIKKAEVLKKAIKQKGKAVNEKLEATIALFVGYPFPLKYFEARPYVKKTKGKKRYLGVTYRIEKAAKNRNVIHDAFIAQHYKHHVFRRKLENQRGPLVRLNGPSPGDYYDALGLPKKSAEIARRELPKQIDRRIQAVMVARTGAINLRADR